MSASRVKPGDVLGGKYRVERVLGTGGMGMVVSAKHVQLGQRVALKFMLKEALTDPGNAERFAREARAAVRLQSAHTARVSDVGKLKNGEPYMVMEYLDGQDLDEVLRRNGPMPPTLAVGYMLQACEAFAEAHSLGMIHRDIKPKNLFLSTTVDGRPIVKVLDFGLAKTIGGTGDISLTATSAVFGSPQYMSPEQMRSAKDVDTRSDIWSIGVCLYELLTGRLPFDAAGLAEICAMVLKDPVEPPSKWARGLPLDLDSVIVKCLAKDPKERFQTVAELAFALEPWAEMEEGSARRILHVMQTVQKVDVPTIVNAPATDEGEGAKTMDAWDSGERTRPHRRFPMAAWWAMGGGAVFLGLIGIGLMAAVVSSNKTKHATIATAVAPSATVALIAEPPADPAPAPAPTPVPMQPVTTVPTPSPTAATPGVATPATPAAPATVPTVAEALPEAPMAAPTPTLTTAAATSKPPPPVPTVTATIVKPTPRPPSTKPPTTAAPKPTAPATKPTASTRPQDKF